MTKNLNEKIAELDKKVEWFYSDDFKLEEAVGNYKEAASSRRMSKSLFRSCSGAMAAVPP